MTEKDEKSLSYKLKAGLFLATTGGIGLLAGFSGALATAKKQDPASFDKESFHKPCEPHKRVKNSQKMVKKKKKGENDHK